MGGAISADEEYEHTAVQERGHNSMTAAQSGLGWRVNQAQGAAFAPRQVQGAEQGAAFAPPQAQGAEQTGFAQGAAFAPPDAAAVPRQNAAVDPRQNAAVDLRENVAFIPCQNAAIVPVPTAELLQAAEQHKNPDWLACFERSLTCEATKNVTIPQAMQMLMGLSMRYLKSPDSVFQELGEAIKQAAVPMVKPIGQVSGASEVDEYSSFFVLAPDQVQSVCTLSAADLPPQVKDLFEEKRFVKNSNSTVYYVMLLLIRRHGPNMGLIDFYYASVESREANVWQQSRSLETGRAQLAALKVSTQSYLARQLCLKDPTLKLVPHEDSTDAKNLLHR